TRFSRDWSSDVCSSDLGKVLVPASSAYSCKKIISQSLNGATKDDFAVIELDRKVTDRNPLKFRRSGKVTTGTPLVVIGHPTGLRSEERRVGKECRARRW